MLQCNIFVHYCHSKSSQQHFLYTEDNKITIVLKVAFIPIVHFVDACYLKSFIYASS